MSNTLNYQFTKEGFESLQKELAHLEARRPQVVTNLTSAREQGDLSENAGYHAAREELGQIDSRVKEIKYLLRVGKVVEDTKGEFVAFGSNVELEANGQLMRFQIVEELEADPTNSKISTNSPIGAAVIGKKVGEQVIVNTPTGKTSFKINKIV